MAGGAGGSQLPGYMLQLFVHKSVAEQHAYPSQAMGIPIAGSITKYLAKDGCADGQARVYFDPQTFLDPRKGRVFHYCARPSQGMARSASSTPFLRALRSAIAPLVTGEQRADTIVALGLEGLLGLNDAAGGSGGGEVGVPRWGKDGVFPGQG